MADDREVPEGCTSFGVILDDKNNTIDTRICDERYEGNITDMEINDKTKENNTPDR
jgi:hypothetical protein